MSEEIINEIPSYEEYMREKMETLINMMLHQSALHSFKRFLEDLDISESEYSEIKKVWKERLGIEACI